MVRVLIPALLIGVAVIGWLDYVTGQYALSLFYLVPVLLAAWFGGRIQTFIIALGASICWYFADIIQIEAGRESLILWNSASRLLIFIVIGVLVVRLREDRATLQRINARLEETLKAETEAARTDFLTGLSNSRAFIERMSHRLETSDGSVALVYIDLDHFKCINDRYGHPAGDALLRRISALISDAIREEDLAARIGGDEFVILFSEVRRDAAESVARRIVARIAELRSEYQDCAIGATAGVVFTRHPPSDPEILIRAADELMYENKARSRGSCGVIEL